MSGYTKNPVGAHYGVRDWLLQRLTAVVMAVCTVVFVGILLVHAPSGYAEWRALFTGPLMRAFTLLFFLALFYHAWVGARDILMDYVHPTGLRLALQFAVVVALILYLIWIVSVLWSR